MEKIAIDQNRVILKDNKRNRIVEVLLKGGELQYLLDERPVCVYMGFVYSLPEPYYNGINVPTRSVYRRIIAP
jgi:hypothetical protein